jgi:hypothetical protein
MIIAASKALVTLNLSKCMGLTNAGIRGLELTPTLQTLKLAGTLVDDLTNLRLCNGLIRLDASLCRNLTLDGAIGLTAIPTPKELDLSGTNAEELQ